MTPTPYTVEIQTIGWLSPQQVLVAYMPKEDFIGLIDVAIRGIEDITEDAIRELHQTVDPVAADMERFALNAWFEPERGCGCLVGETLIAGAKIEFLDQNEFDPNISAREKLAERWGDCAPASFVMAEHILVDTYGLEMASLLSDLGVAINLLVCQALDVNIEEADEEEYDDILLSDDVKSVIFV